MLDYRVWNYNSLHLFGHGHDVFDGAWHLVSELSYSYHALRFLVRDPARLGTNMAQLSVPAATFDSKQSLLQR